MINLEVELVELVFPKGSATRPLLHKDCVGLFKQHRTLSCGLGRRMQLVRGSGKEN